MISRNPSATSADKSPRAGGSGPVWFLHRGNHRRRRGRARVGRGRGARLCRAGRVAPPGVRRRHGRGDRRGVGRDAAAAGPARRRSPVGGHGRAADGRRRRRRHRRRRRARRVRARRGGAPRRQWQARGVSAIARVVAPGLVRLDGGGWSVWRPAAALRQRAAAAIASPLVRALVLGTQSALPAEVEDAFRRSGVSHVLSVSGLHLAAVTFLLYMGVRRAWLLSPAWATRIHADKVAAAAAIPVAILYTMVTGATVATVRALVCALIFLVAKLAGRRTDGLTVLALAALAILVVSPLQLYDV